MRAIVSADVLPAAVMTGRADRLAALFDAHYDRLYRLARRLAPSADDARDLVQETFLKVARSAGSIPAGAADEEAWLVRVLINVRRDQWRKAAVRRRHQVASIGSSPEVRDQEAALVAHATIWRALEALPPRRRAIVVMHEIEGLDVRAIASLLGVSAVTVRWHLSRGRRELARVLAPRQGER